MKKFVPDKKMRQGGHKTQYVAYGPKLTIGGKEIAYIHCLPVRFLGKLIYEDLKDDGIRNQVTSKLQDLLQLTNKSQTNGIMKLDVQHRNPTKTYMEIYNLQLLN